MYIDAMESDILSYRHFYRGNMTHFFLGKKIWLFQKLVLIFLLSSQEELCLTEKPIFFSEISNNVKFQL